jgi:general secretion pathway protein I
MRRAAGFTLIEVLAAVAVFALAMGAIISGSGQYAANATYLRDKTIATWVARNKLVELHLAPSWPEIGRSDGKVEMAGREWRWQVDVQKTPDDSIRRIDIEVDAPGRKEALTRLSGFLAASPVAP